MTKRRTTEEILKHLDSHIQTDDPAAQSALEYAPLTGAVMLGALYDVLCGIEAELHEQNHTLTNLNRSVLAAVTSGMSIKELIPHEPPKDHPPVPEPDSGEA